MATDIAGLFGLTPESYKLAQEQQAQAQAMKFAEMDPFQRANYGLFLGGRQLGGALGQALGAQDPMLQRISQRQNLLQQVDLNDPDSLKAAIQRAVQAKDYELASNLTTRYQDTIKLGAEIGLKQAQSVAALTDKLTPEQKNAQALADSSGLNRGTVAWAKAYDDALKALTAKTITPHIETVGVAAASKEPVYFDKTTSEQFTIKSGKRVPYEGGIDRSTSTTTFSPEIF